MEPIRLFISLPFLTCGREEDYPLCLRRFRAPELRRYLEALRREIPAAAEGLEDCAVTEVEFGLGSFTHLPPEDLEALYRLIGKHFRLEKHCAVTLQAAPAGFDFFRLNAARHMDQAWLRFLIPSLDAEQLRAAAFGTPEEALAALEVCYQDNYHRFTCRLSPKYNPTPEILRASLTGLLAKRPGGFLFDAPLGDEERALVRETLPAEYRETPQGWLRGDLEPPAPAAGQVGCGLGAVTRFGDSEARSSTDFDFYCAHSDDFELLVQS